MPSFEKLFRILSLVLVGVGFMASIAGADKEGAAKTVDALELLINDIKMVEEINAINGVPNQLLPEGAKVNIIRPELAQK